MIINGIRFTLSPTRDSEFRIQIWANKNQPTETELVLASIFGLYDVVLGMSIAKFYCKDKDFKLFLTGKP